GGIPPAAAAAGRAHTGRTRRCARPGQRNHRAAGSTGRHGSAMSVDDTRRYCPVCASTLVHRRIETHDRLCCPACDYTFWDNPTPVVAGLVEYDGRLVFARNAAWPQGKFGLIAGFLEPYEDP